MTWFFVWWLVGAGAQVSRAYPSLEACRAARDLAAVTLVEPDRGQRIERASTCQSSRRGPA